MATSTTSRTSSRRAQHPKARSARAARIKPAAARRSPHRSKPNPTTAALKRFAKLLQTIKASAATMTSTQRTLIKRAIKHAHAALD